MTLPVQPALSHRSLLLSALGLWITTALLFSPTLTQGFLNYDDPDFIISNPWVNSGLTWAGVRHAFFHADMENWQPLTWISHMVDCSLYGLSAWGHHLTSVLLHSTSAAVLYIALVLITGCTGRSFMVAALFALHPLRVESVAWITARRDVLSMLFCLLSMLSYAWFAKCRRQGKPASVYYGLSLLAYLLGLMSKSMIITLPCLLLLLDGWPLQRYKQVSWQRLLLGKLPFFLVALALGVFTVLVKHGGTHGLESLFFPLSARLQHAPVSYVLYLGTFLYPVGLAIYYPHPIWHDVWKVVLSGGLLLLITGVAFLRRRDQPWLLTGWLWFIGSMLPMIGIVQFGRQAMADRFTYLPMIGLTLMLVWGVDHLLARRRSLPKFLMPVAGSAAIASCLWLTSLQIGHWRSNETLFRHALAVTESNDIAHINLGTALRDAKRLDEAIIEFQAARSINPQSAMGDYNLGALYNQLGRMPEAIAHFTTCVQLYPNSPRFRFGLAAALLQAGRGAEAVVAFQETLRLDPNHVDTHLKLGFIYYSSERYDIAQKHYEEVVRLRPDNANAHNDLASSLFSQGKLDEAIIQYREALRLNPSHRDAAQNLNALLRIKAGLPVQ